MRFWSHEKKRRAGDVSSAPAVMSTSYAPSPGFISCCVDKVAFNHAYIRAQWTPCGVQHVGDGSPDLELWNCNRCGTTRGIEVVCPGGVGHAGI